MEDLPLIRSFIKEQSDQLDILKEAFHDYTLALEDYEAYKDYCTFFNWEVKPLAALEDNLRTAYQAYFQ